MRAKRISISSGSCQSTRIPQKKTSYFYAVAIGREVGVFTNPSEARTHTLGFSNSKSKKFKTRNEAHTFIESCGDTRTRNHNKDEVGKGDTVPTHVFDEKETSGPSKTEVKETITKHESTETNESSTTTTTTTTTVTTTIFTSRNINLHHVPVEHCGKHRRSGFGQTNNHTEDEQQRPAKRSRQCVATTFFQSPNHARLISDKLRLEIQIVFDGGSRGNPGVSGAGAVVTIHGIWDSEQPPIAAFRSRSYHVRHYLGTNVTSNEAEYHGLLAGLLVAKREAKRLGHALELTTTDLNVRGDSSLVIEQLKGSYKCKGEKLVPLFRKANRVLDVFSSLAKCKLSFEHIYRDHNAKADDLANQAMDSRRSWFTMSDDNHQAQHDASIFL